MNAMPIFQSELLCRAPHLDRLVISPQTYVYRSALIFFLFAALVASTPSRASQPEIVKSWVIVSGTDLYGLSELDLGSSADSTQQRRMTVFHFGSRMSILRQPAFFVLGTSALCVGLVLFIPIVSARQASAQRKQRKG